MKMDLADFLGQNKPEKEKGVITALKVGIKNANRVNVHVNGKFLCSLDALQVTDMGLKLDGLVDLEELREASEFGKMYSRVKDWALIRPRSEKETYDYLRKGRRKRVRISKGEYHTEYVKGEEDLYKKVIQRLKNRGFVDDKKFAEIWGEKRKIRSGISQRRLKLELLSKGIGDEAATLAIAKRDDVEEVKKVIQRKKKSLTTERLIRYLLQQGFPYDIVKKEVLGAERDW